MADAAWADVVRVAKKHETQLVAVDPTDQTFFLTMVQGMCTEDDYGTMELNIQAYAAAHFAIMSIENPAAGKGPMSSEAVGDTSINYTLPVLNTKEAFGETQYGRAVKKLMQAFGPPTFIVANPI